MRIGGRLRSIFGWAVQSVRFHATRSALTILALALSTALMASTLGFLRGYEGALARNIESLGYQILVTGKGCPHEAATLILRGGSIPMYIRDEVYQWIVNEPEVDASTRFFMQAVPGEEEGSYQLYVGIDEDFLALKPDVRFQRGEWFSSELADEVILGFNVAEFRRLEIGDTLEVQGRTLAVVGVLDKLGNQDDGTVFLPLAIGQSLFEKRDRLTGIGIRLSDMGDAPAFIERVSDMPSVQVVRMSQVQTAILDVLQGIRALLLGFVVLCLVVAGVGVMNVALITVHERVPEMGVIRALGCSSGMLFRLAWAESLILSLAGVVVGLVLVVLLRGGLEWLVRDMLSFVPSGTTLDLGWRTTLPSALTVAALCLVAGLVPAWRASSVPPMMAMRADA